MPKKTTPITSLPRSLHDDQRSRMIKYSVMMGIRIVCIGLCLVVQGWWLLIFAVGAIFLPYFAVVVANNVDSRVSRVERPGSILPYAQGSVESPVAEDSHDQPTA